MWAAAGMRAFVAISIGVISEDWIVESTGNIDANGSGVLLNWFLNCIWVEPSKAGEGRFGITFFVIE